MAIGLIDVSYGRGAFFTFMHSVTNFYNDSHPCYLPILFSYKKKQKNTARNLVLLIYLVVILLSNKSSNYGRKGSMDNIGLYGMIKIKPNLVLQKPNLN